jgi:hypothetical protein
MPQFVPVVDVETPANERNPNSKDYAKHRAWEAPHAHSSSNKSHVNRGWEQGNVGWGVVGAFGSNEKDDGSNVRRSTSSSDAGWKMVKNVKGLWVRVKESSHEGSDSAVTMGRGRGRGSGIPLSANIDEVRFSSSSSSHRSEDLDKSRSSSHSRRETREELSRSHSKRDRSRSRSCSTSRRRRSPSKSRRRSSRDEDRRESNHRHRHRSRSRSGSRSRRHRRRSNSRERKQRRRESSSRSKSRDRETSSPKEAVVAAADPAEENFLIDITAVQVVNRLIEVFQQPTGSVEKRLDLIMEVFADDAKISSLKSGKDLLVGADIIQTSFSRATACAASTSKRIFIEASAAASGVSYCFDLHHPGTSPGLGDRNKDAILLYKCAQGKIQQVWGMTDTEKLTSSDSDGKRRVLSSQAWNLAHAIIAADNPMFSEEMLHYHDYEKIETWG